MKWDISGHTYHADDHASQSLPLFHWYILQYITARLLQQFKRDGQVMILQNRFVVVHQRQLGAYTHHSPHQPGIEVY